MNTSTRQGRSRVRACRLANNGIARAEGRPFILNLASVWAIFAAWIDDAERAEALLATSPNDDPASVYTEAFLAYRMQAGRDAGQSVVWLGRVFNEYGPSEAANVLIVDRETISKAFDLFIDGGDIELSAQDDTGALAVANVQARALWACIEAVRKGDK